MEACSIRVSHLLCRPRGGQLGVWVAEPLWSCPFMSVLYRYVCVCARALVWGCTCRNVKEAGKHCFRLLTVPLLVRSSLVYSFAFVRTARIVS